VRIALVAPVDPTLAGNGAALRAAFWRRTLSGLGDVTTIIIPIISDMATADGWDELGGFVRIEPFELSHDRYPALAQRAPEWLGARWSSELPEFDLVVGFRSYVAAFCSGLAAMCDTPVVIDLDDDDAGFHEMLGDVDEARRYRSLVADIRARHSVVMSATGFDGTVWLPNVAALATVGHHSRPPDGPGHVVMVANMGYRPNAEGAQWFLDRVWPLIRSGQPDAELTIAGPGSERFAHGVGFVDDLGELYDSADVAIAPILHGSGTRIKILDAWARRTPVVATSVAIDGLGAIDDEHALIEDRPRHFAGAVLRLLGAPAIGSGLATAAGDLLDRTFDEDLLAERTRTLLRRVVTPPTGPVRLPDVTATETADGMVIDDRASGQVHHLDALTAIVYSLCDGHTPLLDLADTVARLVSLTPEQSLRRSTIALDQLVASGIVADDPSYERIGFPGGRRFRVRAEGWDTVIAHSVYDEGEYPLPDRLPPGTIGIDIGAHIGSFAARLIDSGADRVVAVEPQPDNHTMATINLATHIELGEVDLRHAALWSAPAGQSIVIGAAPSADGGRLNTGGHRGRPRDTDAARPVDGEVVVASETLDDIVASIRRDVSSDGPIWLKLDCEGAEWPILETSSCLDQIDVIVGELHLDIDDSQQRLDTVVERLGASGFDVTITGLVDNGPRRILHAARTAPTP